jgi:phage shock protein E
MKHTIIDTREDFEYAESHVDGAINIPPAKFMTGELPDQLKDVDRDASIIVYCRSGSRSNVVSHMLKQYGFTNITNGVNQGRVEQLLSK